MMEEKIKLNQLELPGLTEPIKPMTKCRAMLDVVVNGVKTTKMCSSTDFYLPAGCVIYLQLKEDSCMHQIGVSRPEAPADEQISCEECEAVYNIGEFPVMVPNETTKNK